jgi:hypothetical protein
MLIKYAGKGQRTTAPFRKDSFRKGEAEAFLAAVANAPDAAYWFGYGATL